jgi:hypothetical protein
LRLSEFTALVQGAPVGPKEIQQWRKDLRRMTKIYRDIKVPERTDTQLDYAKQRGFISTREHQQGLKDNKTALTKFNEARKLFVTFRQNFEKWWKYKFLPTIKREDAPWYHEQVIQKAFRATIELGSLFPTSYDSKTDKHLPAPWMLDHQRERERNIKRYQVAWNDAFKALDEYIEVVERDRERGVKLPPGTDQRPSIEQMDIEGFPVLLRGWNLLKPEDAKKSVNIIREGLKLYKKNAAKRLPSMLKYTVPFQAAWECRADQAATYDEFKTRIKLCMNWPTAGRPDIKRMAHVIAHEMGHHLWKKVLSGGSRKFWEAVIDSDWGPLDLHKLLKMWPEDVKFTSSFASKLEKSDPTLSLQLDVIDGPYYKKGPTFNTREELQELIDEGTTVLTPKNPITDYAAKNNEEAFCEAVGSIVAYGPRTLHPLTRKWLQTILPGMRMGSMRISEMIRGAQKVNAPKSAKGKEGWVKVKGKKLYAEGPEGEDTFGPAIASYKIVDGWIVYTGRNGSEGVIVGPQKALDKWAADVALQLDQNPISTAEPVEWDKSHGGAQHVKLALEAGKKAAKVFGTGNVKIKVIVDPNARSTGEYTNRELRLYNTHKGGTQKFHGALQGISIPQGAHTAAHEVAHLAFSNKTAKGRKALKELEQFVKDSGSYLTNYHSLSGHHEGLMDLAALYVVAPTKLKAKAPDLYKIIKTSLAS